MVSRCVFLLFLNGRKTGCQPRRSNAKKSPSIIVTHLPYPHHFRRVISDEDEQKIGIEFAFLPVAAAAVANHGVVIVASHLGHFSCETIPL